MRSVFIFVFSLTLVFLSSLDVSAQEKEDAYDFASDEYYIEMSESLKLEKLFDDLPKEVKESFEALGISKVSPQLLSEVSFSSMLKEILNIGIKQSGGVFSSLGLILLVLLLYSLVEGFLQSITADTMREVLSVVSTLCIACFLVVPVTDIIDSAREAITVASDLMIIFIPVMLAVLVSCGKVLSGSGYYSLMIFVAEGIAQLSSKLITPMLNVFLGVSLCSTIVPQLRLESVIDLFSKTIKWLLSFSFTIFSALLTFRTLITTSIDSVSTRAVRFTMSSFIPVVGAALSEAYKTVQGSINILKNGVGVFIIFAIGFVFLPIVFRLLLWSFSISVCKTVAQIMNVTIPGRMLQSITTVLSVLLAVVLCVMALFIISTALIITVGGFSS